ncbi:tRNA pseudouridine(38-40) synthase TruA [Roseobacter sp. N2S]|uniref:tRNA pseudouridine(38-40) synthase TruA n=1 Tax=Roseobacter sp. N2S TaxID=2663844 RepID=UPI0028610B96|nr:tRNA pseudouridine(38-40) synthase TruA [Roseobacter sp. N2S]MDR6266167.1 tRNA pseudouridine38-40 synthase [Roseobacter sp. N2S]
MPRFALKIEYHGKPFVGWQRQIDLQSVQGAVENALRVLESDHDGIQGAGRTDAGVHAYGQVAHVDLARDWDAFRLSEALNYHLKPLPIGIVDAAKVDDGFHARFSALERKYIFRLVARRAPVTHDAGIVWQVRHPLDVKAMQEGANQLLGRHDFTTFRSTICQANSPVRTLDALNVTEHPYPGGTEYRFFVRARSFLHNQVRSFVGTLERVGAGSWSPDDVAKALHAKDRAACGPVCPPHGLYLADVTYPEDPFQKAP